MKIDIDLRQLNKAIEKLKLWEVEKIEGVRNVTNASALTIQSNAKRRVNVDTGNLRSRIVMEPVGNFGTAFQVGTNVFYGVYLEKGTGIYAVDGDGRKTPWMIPIPIGQVGSGKKTYSFKQIEIDGQMYYLTRGSKPHPFLYPSFEEEKPHLISNLKAVLSK